MSDVIRDHVYVSWHNVSAKSGDGLKESMLGGKNAFDSLIDAMLQWDAEGKYAKESDSTEDLEEEAAPSGGCSLS